MATLVGRGCETQMFGGKEQVAEQLAGRLRGMPTIVRQSSSYLGPCTLLGELFEDTAIRYYYRRFDDELAFVDKRSPVIHIEPCPACPDWPAGHQCGSAVGTNLR